MNNPMEILKRTILNGGNPQQIVQNTITATTPMAKNLMTLAQNGDSKGLENFARNLLKEKGRDFDAEFAQFMSNFK